MEKVFRRGSAFIPVPIWLGVLIKYWKINLRSILIQKKSAKEEISIGEEIIFDDDTITEDNTVDLDEVQSLKIGDDDEENDQDIPENIPENILVNNNHDLEILSMWICKNGNPMSKFFFIIN